jgi:multiple antibiotic resistance protein
MKSFWLAFIPLFVAIDIIGTIPLYLNLIRGVEQAARKRTVIQAVLTAFLISLAMILAGKWLFKFLGIGIPDFRIAGGLILLVLSIRDLSSSHNDDSKVPVDPSSIGIVPLGIPLVIGPAALTTLFISVDTFGHALTLASLASNLFIALFVLLNAHWVEKILTKNGTGAVGKVTSLLMAAIAVMMIRVGIAEAFHLAIY